MPEKIQIDRGAFRPKGFQCLRGYSRSGFFVDLLAGCTVGLVALPLAMAFGNASGATAQAGIYTAIIGGFIVSALGGSKIQIGGPTGAFVAIVAGIIAVHGLSGLLIVTMMAGVMLLFLGFHGARRLHPFHSPAHCHRLHQRHRVVDRLHAIMDFLGLSMKTNPSEFFERMRALAEALPTLNWTAPYTRTFLRAEAIASTAAEPPLSADTMRSALSPSASAPTHLARAGRRRPSPHAKLTLCIASSASSS